MNIFFQEEFLLDVEHKKIKPYEAYGCNKDEFLETVRFLEDLGYIEVKWNNLKRKEIINPNRDIKITSKYKNLNLLKK